MTYRDIAKAQLQVDEGRKEKFYLDSLGIPTIGIGRNLRDVGLRPDAIDCWFENDRTAAEAIAKALVPSFEHLSDNRKAVLKARHESLSDSLGCGQVVLEAVVDLVRPQTNVAQ